MQGNEVRAAPAEGLLTRAKFAEKWSDSALAIFEQELERITLKYGRVVGRLVGDNIDVVLSLTDLSLCTANGPVTEEHYRAASALAILDSAYRLLGGKK
jgi:hypothetical protein